MVAPDVGGGTPFTVRRLTDRVRGYAHYAHAWFEISGLRDVHLVVTVSVWGVRQRHFGHASSPEPVQHRHAGTAYAVRARGVADGRRIGGGGVAGAGHGAGRSAAAGAGRGRGAGRGAVPDLGPARGRPERPVGTTDHRAGAAGRGGRRRGHVAGRGPG